MKTLDNFSKRILVIAFSISIVLLSASAFIFSIQHSFAQIGNTDGVEGIAVDNSNVYFVFKKAGGGSVVMIRPKSQVPNNLPIP